MKSGAPRKRGWASSERPEFDDGKAKIHTAAPQHNAGDNSRTSQRKTAHGDKDSETPNHFETTNCPAQLIGRRASAFRCSPFLKERHMHPIRLQYQRRSPYGPLCHSVFDDRGPLRHSVFGDHVDHVPDFHCIPSFDGVGARRFVLTLFDCLSDLPMASQIATGISSTWSGTMTPWLRSRHGGYVPPRVFWW